MHLMKHPSLVVLGAVTVLPIVWWFSTPLTDRAIWELLAVALSIVVAQLMLMGVEVKKLKLQVQEMLSEVSALNHQVTDLTAEACHDKLTGLGNRNLLEDRFALARERANRNKTTFALLMIDLNEFKSINDLHGHAAGDEVLVAIATRLLANVRGTDSVIRLGGDEFVVLVEEAEKPEGLFHFGQKLMETFTEDVELSNHQLVHVGASMGMARFPVDGNEIVQLLDLADQGMYECKASTRMPLGLA